MDEMHILLIGLCISLIGGVAAVSTDRKFYKNQYKTLEKRLDIQEQLHLSDKQINKTQEQIIENQNEYIQNLQDENSFKNKKIEELKNLIEEQKDFIVCLRTDFKNKYEEANNTISEARKFAQELELHYSNRIKLLTKIIEQQKENIINLDNALEEAEKIKEGNTSS
jgi:myosin heavy subunit